MQVFKKILDVYIDSSCHVAVAVFCLLQITKLQLNISTDFNLDLFIFFGTILGYNFLKYLSAFRSRTFTFKKYQAIVLMSVFAIFAMLYLYFQLTLDVQIAFLGMSILVLVYPFIRKFASIKMIFVSLTLTLITVYIPTISQDFDSNNHLQRFLIIFCLLIPQEICDIETDSKTILTLPQIIGISQTKILGYFLLLCLCLLSLSLMTIFIAISTAVFIYYANSNSSKYYCSFWVESLPIIWFVLIYILKVFW